MIRILRPASALALLAAAIGAFAQSNAAKTIVVADAASLVRAVAPGRTILLKKGDYLLSEAYGVESDYAKWDGADGGRELSLSGLENLTIRGAKGARIVCDSSSSAILALYDSESVALKGIVFERRSPTGPAAEASEDSEDSETGAGSLYAEAVSGLSLEDCSFAGATATAIELWGCDGVSIDRCDISGADSGALSASRTGRLKVSASRVSDCEGYPLLYFDESGGAVVEGTRFVGNGGGTFVEVRSEEEGTGTVRFSGCSFEDNEVDYFSEPGILPVTDSCSFSGNSFGEDWASRSVAPASEEEYASDDEYSSDEDYPADEAEAPPSYAHPSGLSFSYPDGWQLVEYKGESRVGVFAPDGASFALFLVASRIPSGLDPAASPAPSVRRLFADSAASLSRSLREKAGLSLSIEADGEPYTDEALVSADYEGEATRGAGERAAVRARFVAEGGLVCAMLGFAADRSALESEGAIDGIFSSIVRTAARDGGD